MKVVYLGKVLPQQRWNNRFTQQNVKDMKAQLQFVTVNGIYCDIVQVQEEHPGS